jgi:hypothetical protein
MVACYGIKVICNVSTRDWTNKAVLEGVPVRGLVVGKDLDEENVPVGEEEAIKPLGVLAKQHQGVALM